MSARRTVAQLTADLEASHRSYQALEAKYEALKAERTTRTGPRPAFKREPSPEAVSAHAAYRTQLDAARELAMRSGKSVRVG